MGAEIVMQGRKQPKILCGEMLGDQGVCRVFADIRHTHVLNDDTGLWHSLRYDSMRDPVPGLFAALTGRPLPTWAELSSKYHTDLPVIAEHDPGPVPPDSTYPAEYPVGPRSKPGAHHADDCPMRLGFVTTGCWCGREGERDHPPTPECVSPERVDFREMLGDDSQKWTARHRIAHVLGRPYLATQLADQLDPETAAKLADRLETLVKQAREEAVAEINNAVTAQVVSAIERLDAQTAAKLREVRNERFGSGSGSRLS